MPDVSLYTAAIAAAAAIAGATVPAVTIVIREGRQARRDRQDHEADERRQACLDLLSAAQQLRVKVANAREYHGPDMGTRLEEIRDREADVQLHAAKVALLTTEELGGLAGHIADAASRLITLAEEAINRQVGEMDPKPSLDGFSETIKNFRVAVVSERRS